MKHPSSEELEKHINNHTKKLAEIVKIYLKELNKIHDDINNLAIKKTINEDELTDILCLYSSLDEARINYRG